MIYTLLWIYAPRLVNRWIGDDLAASFAELIPQSRGLAPHAASVVLQLLVILLCTALAVALLDRRSFAALGLHFNRGWWLDFGFGLALGAVLMAFIFVVEWLAGWIIVVEFFRVGIPGLSFVNGVAGAFLLFLVVGITEELLARGYHLRNLAEGFNWPEFGARRALIIAWLISSSLFGLLHVFNPNATWYSTLALMLAGLFLGLGYVLTGSLAIPIALHITWNFFQGTIFGFPVSGNTFGNIALFGIEQRGPALWTGGAFGPEAGLIGIITIGIGFVLTVAWVQWRQPPVQLQTALAEYQREETSPLVALKSEN